MGGVSVEFLFYAAPTGMIVAALFAARREVGRFWELRRAWSSGLTAEARCLGFASTSYGTGVNGGGSTHTHSYEFTTRAGQRVEFKEKDTPVKVVEGDVVVVHYTADWPEKATAWPPAHRRRARANMVVALFFFGLLVCLCVAFMGYYLPMFEETMR
jgi:hypothetical protein